MSLSEGEGGLRLYLRGEGGLHLCLREVSGLCLCLRGRVVSVSI